ncbi:MAG: transcription elongation factor GreA [Succinivibrionaceae bacterium]
MATPMTVQGYQKIKDELEFLRGTERPRITEEIAEAREHGDLKENAEYHAAREAQSICEAKIKDLEAQLSTAEVIDVTKFKNVEDKKVIFGSTVKLERESDGAEVTYKIVGENESDVSNGLLCYKTPIAKGLLGKYADDDVTIQTPKGKVNYYIIEVLYI